MLCACYLRKNVVYVPSIGRRGGAYVIVEPVIAAPAENADDLRRAFAEAIARGNASLPLLKGKRPPPVMLKYTGTKSWAAFARSTLTWDIREAEGRYKIVGYRLHTDGYWVEDKNQKIEFPPGTTLDKVINRMIAILQDASRQ